MQTWRGAATRRLRVWGARLWRLGLFSVAGWGLSLAGTVATLVLVPVGVILLPVGAGAAALSGWRWMIHGMASGGRMLGRDLLGADTPPLEPVELGPLDHRWGRGLVRRRRQLLGSGRLWRESGFEMLSLLVLLAPFTVVVAAVVGPVVIVGGAVAILFEGGDPKTQMLGLFYVGITALSVPVAYGVEVAMRQFVEWGLGPSSRRRLEARIATLERTRHIAVAAAEDERRRVERDLHDGAQAGMVAVAVQLGLASDAIRTQRAGANEAVAMIEEARRLALGSVEHLRGLARGLHPGVLSARGLAAALAGLAAEAPIPVEVACDPDLGSVSRETEAAAYFCTAEALTNVCKHARAKRAVVQVRRRDGWLLLSVTDDGKGGAVIQHGGGLHGLVERLAALDGNLDIAEHSGGGTRLTITLPAEPAGLHPLTDFSA